MKVKKHLVSMFMLCAFLMVCSVALADDNTMFTVGDANVYAAPNTNAKLVLKVEKAYEVEILNSSDGWYEIRFNNQIGFIEQQQLSNNDPKIEELDVKKLRFGTLNYSKAKKGEVQTLILYRDEKFTTPINIAATYVLPQRVVILDNGRKAKKIAVYGFEAYVPAKNISNISGKYKKERDYAALEQYVLTLRAHEYRTIWKNDAYIGNLTYDNNTQKCVIHYKKGKAPSFLLKPGFQMTECNFSRHDINQAIKKMDAVAQKYGFIKDKHYAIHIFESTLTINISLLDDAGAYMEQFQRDLIKAGVNPEIFTLDLSVV